MRQDEKEDFSFVRLCIDLIYLSCYSGSIAMKH